MTDFEQPEPRQDLAQKDLTDFLMFSPAQNKSIYLASFKPVCKNNLIYAEGSICTEIDFKAGVRLVTPYRFIGLTTERLNLEDVLIFKSLQQYARTIGQNCSKLGRVYIYPEKLPSRYWVSGTYYINGRILRGLDLLGPRGEVMSYGQALDESGFSTPTFEYVDKRAFPLWRGKMQYEIIKAFNRYIV